MQADTVLEFDGTVFRDATTTKGIGLVKSMLDASYGTAVIDANGDGTFTNATNPGSEWCGYPMGIAVGDYDNNGNIDFFFSNVGDTPPGSVARGALPPGVYHPELMLFSNNGGFQLEDTASQVKVANYEFSWGTVLDDLIMMAVKILLLHKTMWIYRSKNFSAYRVAF